MMPEETISLGKFLEELSRYPGDKKIFFGCPDEANPLEFVGIEDNGGDTVQIKFRLNVYKGRD